MTLTKIGMYVGHAIHTMIRLQEFLDKKEKEDLERKHKDIYGQ